MNNRKQPEDTQFQHARIVQASVMDETFILLNFSNDSSALVPSEEIKKLVANSEAKVIHEHDVSD